MFKRLLTWVLVAIAFTTGSAFADEIKGRIENISNKANSIQIDVKGEAQMVRFDQNTEFVNADSIKDLSPPDLIKVEFTLGQPATKITKVIFGLPPGVEIGLEELEAILKKGDYTLVDARPEARYQEGHIPTAISIFAKELPTKLDLLPEDKSALIVFYCGGPTCPFTGESVQIAQDAGYTNLKGFQAGMPGWKKAKKPVHSSPSWVAENLNEHHVVIDVRSKAENSKAHIQTAAAMPASEFKAMTKTFIKEQKPPRLPGVTDKDAPIILYGNTQDADDVLTAYDELKKWRYKNVSILEGGFKAWQAADRPVAKGPATSEIHYVKELKEGAIPPEEFVELEKSRKDVTFLDVRSPEETKTGALKGAKTIPLDELEANLGKLNKDQRIIAYCSNGIRAEMAYELLEEHDFDHVQFLNEKIEIEPNGSYEIE